MTKKFSTTLSVLAAGVGLEAHHVGFAGDAFDLCLGGVDIDVDGVGAGLDGLEVVRFIVSDADEMDAAGVGDGEGEAALAVGFAAGALLHALGEADEDDIVSGGGLASGFVGDGALDGGLGGEYGGNKEGEAESGFVEEIHSVSLIVVGAEGEVNLWGVGRGRSSFARCPMYENRVTTYFANPSQR